MAGDLSGLLVELSLFIGSLVVEAVLELGGELLKTRNTCVNLVQLLDSLLIPLLSPLLDLDQLVSLGLVHGIEALGECLEEGVH